MQHSHQHAHVHHHMARSARFAASTEGSQTLAERASRVLVARSSCTNDSDPGCTKPTQVPTIAIALAVVVPVVALTIVLILLHRRNKRKLAEEDAKDKSDPMDFGLDAPSGGKKNKHGKKGGPEMSITEKEIRGGGRDRGLSLEGGSPYILPVGLHGSRESLHSLSRSQMDPHDPYRPVTFLADNQSVRSQSRGYGRDNGSMYTTRTTSSGGTQKTRMNDGLLKNAQRMSQSVPVRGESLPPVGTRSPDSKLADSAIALSPLNPRFSPPAPSPASPAELLLPKLTDIPVITVPEPAAKELTMAPTQAPKRHAYPPRVQSQTAVVQENANTTSIISTSSYGDGFQVTPPSPPRTQVTAAPTPVAPQPRRPISGANQGLGINDFGHNSNRLSIMRPLPPDDGEENPALRAERIRSFYKEYFDDSKPEPAGGHTYTDYYEDYGSEYHQDGAVFDTRSRGFVAAQPNAPFAAPVTRRAMTPPPRAPPRFQGKPQNGPRGPHMSNSSGASSQYPQRGMSSMSGRLAAPGPRKPLPPPAALSSLPTPAKLTENSMVFDPIDFAPPVSFRDRQNGLRPDSPLGSPRAFSPSVRPHTPLASSFDDLAVMPSPHMLRKSGAFTGLDFAPPPRFRDPAGNNSDAGSIRSNRSGMSAAGRYAVANGANRVSKIPKEMVFTKEDMMNQLRPKLDMVSRV